MGPSQPGTRPFPLVASRWQQVGGLGIGRSGTTVRSRLPGEFHSDLRFDDHPPGSIVPDSRLANGQP
jgi:hypothetical protein